MATQVIIPVDMRFRCRRNQKAYMGARFWAIEQANGFVPEEIPVPVQEKYQLVDVISPKQVKMDMKSFTVASDANLSASIIKQIAKENTWYRNFEKPVCSFGSNIMTKIYGMMNIIDDYHYR
jgi:hypothetical protein